MLIEKNEFGKYFVRMENKGCYRERVSTGTHTSELREEQFTQMYSGSENEGKGGYVLTDTKNVKVSKKKRRLIPRVVDVVTNLLSVKNNDFAIDEFCAISITAKENGVNNSEYDKELFEPAIKRNIVHTTTRIPPVDFVSLLDKGSPSDVIIQVAEKASGFKCSGEQKIGVTGHVYTVKNRKGEVIRTLSFVVDFTFTGGEEEISDKEKNDLFSVFRGLMS